MDWIPNNTEFGAGNYYTKISPPMIKMNVYNKGIGWIWEIEMYGKRTSRTVFHYKAECMRECEDEALALMKTALQELWSIGL